MSFTDGIPWVIAVLGWGATHLFSEARERRKEYRGHIDKLHEQLMHLEQEARAFHCSENYDDVKAGNIVAKLSLIERLIMRIPILLMDDIHPHLIALRRAITLSNFDKSIFKQQTSQNEIVQDVSSATQDLEDELERQYRVRYTHKFPYIRLKSRDFLASRPS